MKNKNYDLCEIADLTRIKKDCPQIIHHCEICDGIIIDHDNVPEKFIVDYDDRRIHSAILYCQKCGAEVCENCVTTIEDTWEKIYICSNCAEKYSKTIKRIQQMQRKADALAEEIAEEIEEFLNGSE